MLINIIQYQHSSCPQAGCYSHFNNCSEQRHYNSHARQEITVLKMGPPEVTWQQWNVCYLYIHAVNIKAASPH